MYKNAICKSFTASLLAAVAMVLNSACATTRVIAQHEQVIARMPAPVQVHRPIMEALAEFGKLLRIAMTATGERDIIIEIDPILNRTGIDKELPNDIAQWLRQVIAQIGAPLRTYEAVPAPMMVRSVFAGPGGPNERPPHPALSYRVVGTVERVFQRRIQGRELETYVRAGNGAGSVDGQMKRNNRLTITRLTLSLTLEEPDGLDARGATAAYSIDVLKDELDRSVGVYVGGTGIGGGSNVTLVQDLGDAIFDASAATLMNVIGAATVVPYFRCSNIFPVDDALNARELDILNRLTRNELEERIKPYLYLSGVPLNMSGPGLTDGDRKEITLQMANRSLDFADRAQLATFAFQLWRDVDIDRAADRLKTRMAEIVRQIKEGMEAKAAEAARKAEREAAWKISPAQFGWADSVQMVLLDLTLVKDLSLRAKIITAVRGCDGCEGVKADGTMTVVGVRLGDKSDPAKVQQAIRFAHLKTGFAWVGDPPKRLQVTAQ